jgi:hypothetical protein
MNRLSYRFQGLINPQKRQDLISYLRSLPEFNDFETQIHLDSADGGKTKRRGFLSATLSLSCVSRVFHYKDYTVEVAAVLGEIYIICRIANI